MYQDQTLICKDCGKSFVWTASEQEFFASKGFSAPVRCQECRARIKAAKQSGQQSGPRAPRAMHEITCANCGAKGEVPFQPRNPDNVLCADCFRQKRDEERGVVSAPAQSAASDDTLPAAEITDNGNDAAPAADDQPMA